MSSLLSVTARTALPRRRGPLDAPRADPADLPLHERGRGARHALRDRARLVPGSSGDGLARRDEAPAQDACNEEPAADRRQPARRAAPLPDPPDRLAQERVDRAVDVVGEAPLI